MVFQDFCLNLSKTKTKLQASIATPRNHQYNERRNHNCTLLFTEYISVIKNFVLFWQFECGGDFEKIFSFRLQWLGFYVYFLTYFMIDLIWFWRVESLNSCLWILRVKIWRLVIPVNLSYSSQLKNYCRSVIYLIHIKSFYIVYKILFLIRFEKFDSINAFKNFLGPKNGGHDAYSDRMIDILKHVIVK